MVDERTIYNYIDNGILSVCNLDLPRKVCYKKRKTKKSVQVDKKCHAGRTYEDFLAFLREANTARSVTEIIDDLYSRLGRELFCRMFPVILTDRGSEFTDPASIEFDEKTEQSIRPSTVQFLLRRGSSLGIENAGYSRKRSDDF